jgi:tetratricopeptide (TPR) repeat protein
MDEGDWASSLSILRRAEALSVRYTDLQLEVFETLSLYYAGTGKHLRALAYLDKLTELTPENPLSRAKLHLNYCAILSQLSRHAQAQTHALKAVFLLQDSVILQSLRGLDPAEMELETLATAYYNLAVEQEHLHEVRFRQYHEARKWHKQALDFATQHLSAQNPCRLRLAKAEETAGNQVEQRIEIKEKRRRSRARPLYPETPTYLGRLKQRNEGKEARSRSTENLSIRKRQSVI